MQSKENNRSGDYRFPLSEGGEARPFILTRKLGRERLDSDKDYCRARGATLNDAVLTAYYRCLFKRLALIRGAKLRIPVMVDMRRYLGEAGEFRVPDQLSSHGDHAAGVQARGALRDTLGRVKAVMDEKKGSDIGLNAFIKLHLIYRILGTRLANLLLSRA